MKSPVTRSRHRLVAVAAASGLLLSGCSALGLSDTGADENAGGGDRQIAAAFYPLQFVAERVAGGRFTVESLTAPGGEPHDLELTIKETALVSDADLVLYEKRFQASVDNAVAENAGGKTLDAAEAVGLIPVEDGSHDHEGHDHGEDGHGEDGHEGHDHGDFDPHFWLDPTRMAKLADAVANQLGELDPDHAEDYTANAEKLGAELDRLDSEYKQGLSGCTRDIVVVSHQAFAYLAKYGLRFESIAGLSPESEASAADIEHLQELIAKEGITTVFAEELVSKKMAETLAEDAGVETAVLDPIEGLSDRTADQDYLSLMRSNLSALQKANGC